MKYPITPDYIKNAPNVLAGYYAQLELLLLADICRRFKWSGASATALEHIRNLQRRGYTYEDITQVIKSVNGLTEAEFSRIMSKALADNREYYGHTLTLRGLTQASYNPLELQTEVENIITACKGNLDNITNTLGFSIRMTNGTRKYLPIAQAYQQVLSQAEVNVWSGAMSYSEAIRGAVENLTERGVRTVAWLDEERGVYHTDSPDVAARRAVMTGVTQLAGAYSDAMAKEVPTECFEVTAHKGARDKDRAGRPWANHKKWQGKVYCVKDGEKYPSIYKVCGLGEVDGLEGANCRHMHYPFWDGISERTYTDEELANIDPPPFEFNGTQYSAYDATQYQRALERQTRRYRREAVAYDAAGDTEKHQTSAIQLRRYETELREFCKAGNLRQDDNRTQVRDYGPRDDRAVDRAILDCLEKHKSI